MRPEIRGRLNINSLTTEINTAQVDPIASLIQTVTVTGTEVLKTDLAEYSAINTIHSSYKCLQGNQIDLKQTDLIMTGMEAKEAPRLRHQATRHHPDWRDISVFDQAM